MTIADMLRLEGQLLDDQRHPVANAWVWADESQAVSGHDGCFAFDSLAPGMYRVHARKDDLVANVALVTVRDGREPVVLTMSRGMTLRLRVLDGETPIVGARVGIIEEGVLAVTDASGLAVVRGLGPQFQLVEVTANGHAPLFVSMWLAQDPGGTIERTVILTRGAACGGIVLGPDEAPVAGAVIRLSSPGWGGETTTDASGRWRFEAVAAGTYQVLASSEGVGASDPVSAELDGLHSSEDIVIRVERRAQLVGLIVDESGGPVPGARVSVHERGTERPREARTRSDEHGRFELLGLEAGAYNVFADDAHRASPEMHVSLAYGEPTHIELVVESARIAGVVVDLRGEPVAEVHVGASAAFVRGDVTDRHGRFDLGAFPRGEYDVEAPRSSRLDLGQRAEARVSAGDTNVRLVMPSTTTLTGRVVLDGAPMTYFGVLLTTCPQFPWIGRPTGFRGDDGRFTFDGVALGTWGLVVAGPGTSLHTIAELVVDDGARVDLGDIQMTRGQRITGHVRDRDGSPVAGTRVSIGRDELDGDPLQQWFSCNFATTTDSDGAFGFDGVTSLRAPNARPSPIGATHPLRGTSRAVALPEGDATIDLTLEPTGTIDGSIEGFSGDFAAVHAQRKGEPADLRSAIVRAGAFVLDRLPEGEYRLEMLGRPDDPVAAPVTVVVVANQRTTVRLVM